MNCYECATTSEAVAAVATCRYCGAGLCPEHVREAAGYRVGGTVIGCAHDIWSARAASTASNLAAGVAGNGQVPVPAGAGR